MSKTPPQRSREMSRAENFNEIKGLAPRVGFEPTTSRLTAGCSTTELPRIRALVVKSAGYTGRATRAQARRSALKNARPRPGGARFDDGGRLQTNEDQRRVCFQG